MPQPGIPHRTVLVQHPLAALALSFSLGIVAARFISLSIPISLTCSGVFSGLFVYFFAKGKQVTSALLLMSAFICLGATLALVETKGIAGDRVRRFYDEGLIASGDPVEVTGVLELAPEPAPDGFYLLLNVEKIRFKENEKSSTGVVSLFASGRDKAVQAEYDALELRYGARVRVMTKLSRTDNFRNPGVSLLTEYLEQRGIDATGVVKSALLIERLDDERVFIPLAWVYEWRQLLLKLFHQRFTPETAGVLAASLLGNRHHLSHGSAERFREGGTFHVLVISGLHISFIGLVVLLIMRRLTKNRVSQFTVTVALLWSYTLAVGAEASVVRAALMFTIVALAPVLNRPSSSLNALGGAGLALLVWSPGDLFDPSFQLTFLSVLGIVAIAWPLIGRLQAVGVWRPTRETPAPPVCAKWWRALGEILFWDEREWSEEMKHSPWRCRLFKTRYADRLQRLHMQRLARYVVTVVVVSVAVQVALLPFLVLYFHRVSFASILLNVFVGALMALLSFSALTAVLVSELSNSLAMPIVTFAEAVNWLMVHSVDPFRTFRATSIRLPEYTGWASLVYVLFYVPLVALTVKLARWNPLQHSSSSARKKTLLSTRIAAIGLIVTMVVIVSHPFSAQKPDGRLHVEFLDVGQGDAALLTMPDGTTILVDGGGQPDFANSRRSTDDGKAFEPFERDRRSIGEAVVSEYLWWRGLDRVDYLVATHADADHIDGLSAVARNFEVGSALVASEPVHDSEYALFASTMRSEGVPIHLIARGDSLIFGAVTIDVLWPAHRGDDYASSRNDDSIVLRVGYGERVFLLTGDIEYKTESILAGAPETLRCDVVKVAHHGSRTSSIEQFVNATRPSLAVISVGRNSVYGHPDEGVVARWRAGSARVMTTGKSGMISVSTDGHDLKIKTFVMNQD